MDSAFTGIEIGKRSLFAHNRALTTVGHNLSNANTEGYSRQRVQFDASDPLYRPDLTREETPGQIGQGVDISRVERVRDELLEGRIVANSSDEGYWQARDGYVKQLEQVYNEPTELSLRGRMDKFWDSWQELSLFPEQMSSRQAVLETGQGLVDGLKTRYQQLDQIRSVLNEEIGTLTGKVNELTGRIADLNIEIVKSKAAGDSPNDLLDKRDLLVNQLSSIINITVENRDPDEYSVYTNGLHIVQGAIHRPFELRTDPSNEGFSKIIWSDTGEKAQFGSGRLAALVDLRDKDLRSEIQGLDNMSVNFMDLVNEVHSASYGINGSTGNDFFVQHPYVTNAQGNYDRNGDGQFDSTYVFRMTGSNKLEATRQIGLKGSLTLSGASGPVNIDYFPTDTVEDLLVRINHSGAEVVARLDRDNRLSLKGTPSASLTQPDFVIRQVQDSGQFLVGYAGLLKQSGTAGAFRSDVADAVTTLRDDGADYAVAPVSHPAAWIAINDELKRDPGSVAASTGTANRVGDIGDGRAALEIADLRQRPVMVGRSSTFDDYFADRVAAVGLKGQEAQISSRTHELIMKNLRDLREGYSGVNIDEELSQMIKFQHGYNSAARFVTVVDSMLDTIINRMGI